MRLMAYLREMSLLAGLVGVPELRGISHVAGKDGFADVAQMTGVD